MTLALINASNPINTQIEWDEYVDYRKGPEACFDGSKIVKRCNSWHSVPCAMRGEFFVYGKPGWQGIFKYDKVIVLVNRDLGAVFPLIKQLKLDKKRKVLVGFHESADDFFQQVSPYHNSDQLWARRFFDLVKESDGLCNVMISYDEWFKSWLKKPVLSIFHAAPYTEWKHGFTVPISEREGIMVGTRTFNQRLRRNTLQALWMALFTAEELDTHVTWVCEEPFSKEQLNEFFALPTQRLNFIKGPLAYEEWVKTIAKHKVLFHFDYSCTLGQLALDAALVDVPLIGGNAEHSQMVYMDQLYTPVDNQNALIDCYDVYDDDMQWKNQVDNLKELTSFAALKKTIDEFFEGFNV